MNTDPRGRELVGGTETTAASYPDLLEMVTRSRTPSPVATVKKAKDNTDVAQLYAKVTLPNKLFSVFKVEN